VTDIQQYNEIRHHYWRDRDYLLQHFPETIPPEATDVQMYYVSTLVGGNAFQLRFTLPPTETEKLLRHYRANRIDTVDLAANGFTETQDQLGQAQHIPTTHFYTSGTDNVQFPAAYEMIVLYAEASGSEENIWNHGASYGVAVDQVAANIVYWVEDW
jgi:hypothetical protein